jgi:hypothetical protein
MQDLTTETPEEKEAMDAIQNQEQNQIIQGATGAQYEAIDFKKFEAPQGGVIQVEKISTTDITQLAQQLTQSFNQLVNALLELQPKQPVSSSSGDLAEAVGIVLQQAEWFREMVDEQLDDAVRDKDFEYEIGDQVERYMRNQFDANDHVDFGDLVQDRVESVIDEIVEEKLSEILDDKLRTATITFG